MIKTKRDLKYYLQEDARASGRAVIRAKFFGDEIWKWQRCYRKYEYYVNVNNLVAKNIFRFLFHKHSIRNGFSIPINTIEEGLCLPHRGTVIIGKGTKIGKYCRIHEGVTIGASNGSPNSASIGNRVFIASGAKIIGDIKIAHDSAIGANAVIVDSIETSGKTWGGVPGRKISENNSHSNLCYWKTDE